MKVSKLIGSFSWPLSHGSLAGVVNPILYTEKILGKLLHVVTSELAVSVKIMINATYKIELKDNRKKKYLFLKGSMRGG